MVEHESGLRRRMGGPNKWLYADGSYFIGIDQLLKLYNTNEFLCYIIPIMPFNMVKNERKAMQLKFINSGYDQAIPMATNPCLLQLVEVIGLVHNRTTLTGNRSTKLY